MVLRLFAVPPVLRARLAVGLIVLAGTAVLVAEGVALRVAAVTAVVSVAGAIQIACRLTSPYPALAVRVAVVIVIVLVVIAGIGLGYPAPGCVATVLGLLWTATEVACRITAYRFLMPVRVA